MSNAQCIYIAELEAVVDEYIKKSEREKKKLEYERKKLLEFKAATKRVGGLSDDSFDRVFILIEKMSTEIHLKSNSIRHLEIRKEMRKCSGGYVKKYSRNDMSLKDRSTEHATVLMRIRSIFEEEIKKLEEFLGFSKTRERFLLDSKQEMIDLSMIEQIKRFDYELLLVPENLEVIEKQIKNLKEFTQSEMIKYSKQFISSSDISRSIIEIWQQHDIKLNDVAQNVVTSPLESTSSEMPNSATQPDPEAIELLSDVATEPVPTSEEQKILEMIQTDQTDLEKLQIAKNQLANGYVNHNVMAHPLEKAATEMSNSSTQAVLKPEPETVVSSSVVVAETVVISQEQDTWEMVGTRLENMHVIEKQLANGFVDVTIHSAQSVELIPNTEDEKTIRFEPSTSTETDENGDEIDNGDIGEDRAKTDDQV